MADFPTKGISEEELVEELIGLYKKCTVADEQFHLYEDWTSQLEELVTRGKTTGEASVELSAKEAEAFYSNQAEHLKKVINLMGVNERFKLLFQLYERHFHPEENRVRPIRDIITHVEETHIKPYLEFFFNRYPETLRKAYRYQEPAAEK